MVTSDKREREGDSLWKFVDKQHQSDPLLPHFTGDGQQLMGYKQIDCRLSKHWCPVFQVFQPANVAYFMSQDNMVK